MHWPGWTAGAWACAAGQNAASRTPRPRSVALFMATPFVVGRWVRRKPTPRKETRQSVSGICAEFQPEKEEVGPAGRAVTGREMKQVQVAGGSALDLLPDRLFATRTGGATRPPGAPRRTPCAGQTRPRRPGLSQTCSASPT